VQVRQRVLAVHVDKNSYEVETKSDRRYPS